MYENQFNNLVILYLFYRPETEKEWKKVPDSKTFNMQNGFSIVLTNTMLKYSWLLSGQIEL